MGSKYAALIEEGDMLDDITGDGHDLGADLFAFNMRYWPSYALPELPSNQYGLQ